MKQGKLQVFRASAGSGKTHNLVLAFLKLAMETDDPRSVRQILAITFTRKASMEMKERIFRQLQFMATERGKRTEDPKGEALEQELLRLTSCTEVELQERSFQYLQHMLHRYADTAISTIDSFITQLARPFYRELRTGLDFDIELDREIVIEQALDEWMKNLGDDNQAVTDLMHFLAQSRNLQEKSWNTRNLMVRYAKFLFEDRTYAHLPQLLERTPESYQKHFDELEARLQQHVDYTIQESSRLAQSARQMGFSTDDFVQKSNGILGHFEKLASTAQGTLHSKAMDALAEGRVTQSNCKMRMPEGWIQEAVNFIQYRSSVAGEIELLSALLEMRYATTLMGSMYRHFMEFNRNQLRMPLNFMYFQMADLIRQTHPEYLCDRVGQRYQHILIDEFQDTSILQWQCLFPLVENAISSGGTALMVGDVKQSIYRWRNGDARLLASLPRDLDGNPVSPLWEGLFEGIPLQTNYRSAPNLIHFNNAFFKTILSNHALIAEPFFKEVEQKLPSLASSIFDTIGHAQIIVLEDDEPSELSLASARVRLCVEIIRAQLAMEVQGKPMFRPNDVAILVRTNKVGTEIAKGLIAAGFAVISPDSLVLGQHPMVDQLMVAWQFIQDSGNALHREALMLALDPIRYKRGELPAEITPWLQTKFPHWEESRIRQLPLGLQLHQIAYIMGCPTEDAYIKRLLDEWTAQCSTGLGVQELNEWWERNRNKIKLQIQDKGDAVTVLTLHSAKGLEFPVVILPELDRIRKLPVIEYQWLGTDQDSSLQTCAVQSDEPTPVHLVATSRLKKGPKHLQEIGTKEDLNNDLDYLNLLYVGLTRAKSSMFILTEKKASNKGPVTFSKLFEEFIKTPTGHELVHLDHTAYESWTMGKPLNFNDIDLSSPISDGVEVGVSEPSPIQGTPIAPADCMKNNLHWQSQWSDPVEAGRLFHDMIAMLDRPQALDAILEGLRSRQDLPWALRDKVRDWILELIQRENLKECWDGSCTILREQAILIGQGQMLRPDLVLLRQDGTARVIEFKTGVVEDDHLQQVQSYVNALRETGIHADGEVVYVGTAA